MGAAELCRTRRPRRTSVWRNEHADTERDDGRLEDEHVENQSAAATPSWTWRASRAVLAPARTTTTSSGCARNRSATYRSLCMRAHTEAIVYAAFDRLMVAPGLVSEGADSSNTRSTLRGDDCDSAQQPSGETA